MTIAREPTTRGAEWFAKIAAEATPERHARTFDAAIGVLGVSRAEASQEVGCQNWLVM